MIPRHDIPDWVARHPDWVARHPDVDPPQPRALCALSEDRQWLVVLSPENIWMVLGFYLLYGDDPEWGVHEWYEDTGQDAHEVLAAWLGGKIMPDRAVVDEGVEMDSAFRGLVSAERDRQDILWGLDHDTRHTGSEWVMILTRYVGKFADAVETDDYTEAQRRLVQIAAVAEAAHKAAS